MYFFVIRFVSSSKLLLMALARCNYVRKVFLLYFNGIREVQNIGILFGLVYTEVVMSLPSCL